MRLSKIGKVVKEARQCVLCNTRERQTRYNREWARRRLALLMDANFGKNDLHVTLTYRGTPPDYEQARKDVRNYLRAVKKAVTGRKGASTST